MSRLIKIFLILFLFLSPITSLHADYKAHAASLTVSQKLLEETYIGAVTAIAVVAGAGYAVGDKVYSSLGDLRATASETWGLMSSDMKNNFATSVASAKNGAVTLGNWFDATLTALSSKGAASATVSESKAQELRGKGKSLEYGLRHGDGSVVYGTIYYIVNMGNYGYVHLDIGSYAKSYSYVHPRSGTKFVTEAQVLAATMATKQFAGVRYKENKQEIVVTSDNLYNQTDRFWRDRAGTALRDAGLVIPQPVPYTPDGVRLGINSKAGDGAGALVLPDGTLHTGDTVWVNNVPKVIDGKPAVLNPSTGDYVNPTTGDIVGQVTVPDLVNTGVPDIVADTVANPPIVSNPPIVTTPTVPIEGAATIPMPTTGLNFEPLKMSTTTLTRKFPFSIPFDFARQLAVFNVSPEVPVFKVDKPNLFQVGGVQQHLKFELDFKPFDPLAGAIRWFLLIAFDVSLILAIRKLLPE